MGIFSKDKDKEKDKSNGDGAEKQAIKSDELKGIMGGFSGLQDLADSFVKNPPTKEPQPQTTRSSRDRKSRESQEKAEEERLKLQAMEVIGKQLMAQIASIPYDTWAFLASDPALKLSPSEQKQLADSYYLLAQAVNPDFSKPIWIMTVIALQNLSLVGVRLKHLATKQEPTAETPELKPN